MVLPIVLSMWSSMYVNRLHLGKVEILLLLASIMAAGLWLWSLRKYQFVFHGVRSQSMKDALQHLDSVLSLQENRDYRAKEKWTGSWQIRAKARSMNPQLRELARRLRVHLSDDPNAFQPEMFRWTVALGLFLLLLMVAITVL